ncbi:MAG: autotransporter outer membrane beta-barrel domain-containing protein [Planctomycetes bacterium]|nr:autotransporter outer membrane beta-barrel domain-containing protein [Planctomycetota bacterium]
MTITLTEDAISHLSAAAIGQVVISTAAGGEILLPDGADRLEFNEFLYGDYTYALDASGDLILAAYDQGVLRDGTHEDYQTARDRIGSRYGRLGWTDGFSQNIYKSAVRDDAAGVPPYDRLQPSTAAGVAGSAAAGSYTVNMANFQAFARGNGDTSLAAMYTGVANAAATEIALFTTGAVIDHLTARRRSLAAVPGTGPCETVCSDAAVGSIVLEPDVAGRVWLGGFGMIEEAVDRDGIPGYRYTPGGFIMGYDQAVGDLVLGAAYAYASGDFADKSSYRHDSTISSHSFALHGTYSHPSGVFAGVIGGYTHSSNDLSELRRDHAAGDGFSWNKAEYHAGTWHGGLEIGYQARPTECLTLVPSVGFTAMVHEANNHTERLGEVDAGRVRGLRNRAALLPIKLEVGYEIPTGSESRLRLTGNAGYAYNFTDDDVSGSFDPLGFANAFRHDIVGRKTGHHLYSLGAGLRFHTDRFDIGLHYTYNHKTDFDAHRITATAGFSF